MRKTMKWVREYRREFVYASFIFLNLEMLVTRGLSSSYNMYWSIAVMGYLLIISWLVGTYFGHSKKKVSKYADVLKMISLRSRFIGNIALPLLFYTALVFFLFVNRINYLDQILIVSSVFLFFYLFLHVRTSYEKVYSVARMTRTVYDFVGIAIFFAVSYSVAQFSFGLGIYSLMTYVLSTLLLSFALITHRKDVLDHLLVIVLSALFVTAIYPVLWFCISYFTDTGWYVNSFALPAVSSVGYYTVISMWNVRFEGYRKFSEYIPPIMYALMIIILILSL